MEKVKEADLPKKEKEKRINELAIQLGKLFVESKNPKKKQVIH